MDISFFCLFVCLFVCVFVRLRISSEDTASGVAFGSAVYRHPRQGIFMIFVNFAFQEAQIGQRAGHADPHVNITVEMR